MAKVCDKYCHNCIYFHGWFEYNAHCNYIFMAGHRRMCPPGKGCIRKVERKRRRKVKRSDNNG